MTVRHFTTTNLAALKISEKTQNKNASMIIVDEMHLIKMIKASKYSKNFSLNYLIFADIKMLIFGLSSTF